MTRACVYVNVILTEMLECAALARFASERVPCDHQVEA